MPADSLIEQLQTSLGTAYTIERELGGGGMSRVFLATETSLGREVVVKVLPPETAASVSIERFKREIQLAARLQHPHIVPLLTAGESGGLPYFTMPFIAGESLRVRLARHGEMPVLEAVRVLREIASALAYAHERGIVHRDMKPDNVLLSGGAAMVTDFGVAKALSASSNAEHGGATSLGVALGTPAYMSPEQASADPAVDHRADVYAFGVLAYELLTGQTPFGGRTPQGLLAAHVTEAPEPIQKRRASLPPGLSALVMRCLEKRPSDRPQAMSEVVHALDDLSTPSGGMHPTSAVMTDRAAPRVTGLISGRERSRWPLAVGLVATVAVIGGYLAWTRAQHVPQAGAAPAAAHAIAVMPLDNASTDTASQFFADGMTDELTATVARLPGVHVASRSATSAAAKATAGDMKALGQRLGVTSVLEGRIRRSGDRMRLTAQLVNIADGLIIWTESYDRKVSDAFQVQDEVAKAIAAALRVTLGGGAQALATRGTESNEAHDLYLRGRFVQAKYTEPNLRKSLELFRQALEKDPKYVSAWAGIADSWGMLGDDFLSPLETVPKESEALRRGLAIDSTSPELRFARGIEEFYYDRDAAKAARSMAGTLAAERHVPGYGEYYAAVLWTIGQRDSAASLVRQAVERDPASPDALATAFSHFLKVGDTTTASSYCDRLGELGTGIVCRARLAEQLHPEVRIAQLQARLADPERRTRRSVRSALVRAYLSAGKRAEARALALEAEADAASGRQYEREDRIAYMWAEIGDFDRAFRWFDRALASRSSGIGALYWESQNQPIRNDPRFRALAKRAGLPDPPPYWP